MLQTVGLESRAQSWENLLEAGRTQGGGRETLGPGPHWGSLSRLGCPLAEAMGWEGWGSVTG